MGLLSNMLVEVNVHYNKRNLLSQQITHDVQHSKLINAYINLIVFDAEPMHEDDCRHYISWRLLHFLAFTLSCNFKEKTWLRLLQFQSLKVFP